MNTTFEPADYEKKLRHELEELTIQQETLENKADEWRAKQNRVLHVKMNRRAKAQKAEEALAQHQTDYAEALLDEALEEGNLEAIEPLEARIKETETIIQRYNALHPRINEHLRWLGEELNDTQAREHLRWERECEIKKILRCIKWMGNHHLNGLSDPGYEKIAIEKLGVTADWFRKNLIERQPFTGLTDVGKAVEARRQAQTEEAA